MTERVSTIRARHIRWVSTTIHWCANPIELNFTIQPGTKNTAPESTIELQLEGASIRHLDI
jgi:hypothetical protein